MSDEPTKPEDEDAMCVYYEETKCPVRKEMRKNSRVDSMFKNMVVKPDSEAVKYAETLGKAITNEWALLNNYCHMCPVKFKKDNELSAEIKVKVERSIIASLNPYLDEAVTQIVKRELAKKDKETQGSLQGSHFP